jgi:hypothetical protein
MGFSGRRRPNPFTEFRGAAGLVRRLYRLRQPGVKPVTPFRGGAAVSAHVVIAHAAACHQYALFAQGLEGAAGGYVGGRIEAGFEGKLHDRNVRVRIDHFERHEHAVV